MNLFKSDTWPLTFHSDLPFDECMEMLKSSIPKETLFSSMGLAEGSFIAKFYSDGFRLRQKTFMSNGFALRFYGKLRATESRTEITGEFRTDTYTRIFMTIWFTFAFIFGGLLFLVFLSQAISSHHGKTMPELLLPIFVPIAIPASGLLMVLVGKRLSKGQEAGMTIYLDSLFGGRHELHAVPTAVGPDADVKLMQNAAIFLAIGAFGNLVGSFAMPAAIFGHHLKIFALLIGPLSGLLAYGTWKRLKFTWVFGLAFIALAFAFSIVLGFPPEFSHLHPRLPLAFVVFWWIGGIAVGGFWEYWWYKKKPYFHA